MSRFKIISIDMFQTLVNVECRKSIIWQTILKDNYTPESADEYWKRANELVFGYFKTRVIKNNHYMPVKSIFQECYSQLFSEISCTFDPMEAAQVLAEQHPLSPPFHDALPFLRKVGELYPICLASDTDDDMLGSLMKIYDFDHIFTSEQLQAYKIHPSNKFFKDILDHYQLKPQQIIHIGDSSSDILGPQRLGIVTCWLNRNDQPWLHEILPDYVVGSLSEAASIL
ncbi:HAD family hydrolase [Thermodesulfobacteriota bacterium]